MAKATKKTAPAAAKMAARDPLHDDIAAIVLERCIHYRTRLDARARIPAGARAEVDLSLRIRGRLTKDQPTQVAPSANVLCRRVLADVARQLKIEPARLKAALLAAGKRATKKKQFLGDDGLDLADPHVAAIAEAEAAIVEKLAKVGREGSLRFDGTVDEHKRSTVIVRR